jgi:hypothetical protein
MEKTDNWAQTALRICHFDERRTIDSMVERQTSAIEPIFTRTFGSILSAQCNTRSRKGEEIQQVITELRSIEAELHRSGEDFGFERSFLLQTLFHAYVRSEDKTKCRTHPGEYPRRACRP